MDKILESPATFVTVHFDEDESELVDLFFEYLREGWGCYVHGVRSGVWSSPADFRAVTFFVHRSETVAEVWEDFVFWLQQEDSGGG